MNNLYEIIQSLENLDFINMETGEVNTQMLDDLQIARDEKIKNIALFIKNLQAESKAIKEEEKSLAERRKAKENKADSLFDYLDNMLKIAHIDRKEYPQVVLSFRKSTTIEVQETDFLKWVYENNRLDLLRIKPPEVDKTAIKNQLKIESIPFVDIVEKQNLQIK